MRRLLLTVLAGLLALTLLPAAQADPDIAFPQDPESTWWYDSDWRAYNPRTGRRHYAVDLFAPRGSEVYAALPGTADIGRGRIGGNWVKIKHADGWGTYYAHLDGFAIADGQWVEAGQLIGYTGNTGSARGTQPHTHFGLRRWGKWVNPIPHLKPALTEALELEPQPERNWVWDFSTSYLLLVDLGVIVE